MVASDSEAYDRRVAKALDALSVCVQQVRTAIDGLKAGSRDNVDAAIWHASAQAEYALFLIGLNLGDRNISDGFPKRHQAKLSEDLASGLQRVIDAITKTMEQIRSDITVDVYEDLLKATSVLISIQEKNVRYNR